jgi:hypothetical protein
MTVGEGSQQPGQKVRKTAEHQDCPKQNIKWEKQRNVRTVLNKI